MQHTDLLLTGQGNKTEELEFFLNQRKLDAWINWPTLKKF